MNYGLAFAVSAGLALGLAPLVRRLAIGIGAVDMPGEARRIHTTPRARLGGLAIYVAIVTSALLFLDVSRPLLGLLGGLTVLVIMGAVDDVRPLSPRIKLAWQVVSALVALSGGIGIYTITNPFGGVITLDLWRFPVHIGPLDFHITPIANLLSLLWMVGLVNVVNFLDGLDGLACGTSAIAAVILFLLSLSVGQPETALLALVVAGACFGFLPFNFFPAKIFLGDSGAYTLGLVLALIAIYSGGKLATAALVLGFTIIDGLWVAARRIRRGQSPLQADRLHLHHLMFDTGFSQRQTVLVLYLVALGFGLISLWTGTVTKLVALGVLFVLVGAAASYLIRHPGRIRR